MEPVILLIEDSENDALLLRHAFKKAGLVNPLQVVRDGVDAMSYLRGLGEFADREKNPLPHILLIDLNLPRLNGLELLAWLGTQAAFQHLMVVVLTGSARKEEINTAYKMGIKSYLVKPTPAQSLQRLVEAFYQYWIVHNHLPDAPLPSQIPLRATDPVDASRRAKK
jgi:CheY-like chemotaxis protein